MRKIDLLCYIIVLLTLVTTTVGLLYSTGGERIFVENIYGEIIELYGDGIYKYNSVLKAGANKGTDLVMLIVAVIFAFLTLIKEKYAKFRFWQVGALFGLLYYASCLVFGVTFNQMFPIYVMLFSTALFAMIYLMQDLLKTESLIEAVKRKSFKGTAIFLLICGSSTLVWMEYIMQAIISGEPLSIIEIYTTEPTFVFDLGIVLPIYIITAIALLKKKSIGYMLTPILLSFIVIVGLTVIGQNAFQMSMGIDIPFEDFMILVVSFVILGMIATILNVKYIKKLS